MTESQQNQPRFIAVEGPIGVGKTTLARRLAESLQGELILEEVEDNPFLERFYRDPRGSALPCQLYFLFQRIQQLKGIKQSDLFQPVRIADFLVQKDRLFAQVTLDDDELRLYQEVYKNLAFEAPVPDLVIYLQAPVPVLSERIRKRGRAMERAIEPKYLNEIASAYTDYFHYYQASPLLIVNASGIDLVSRDDHFEQLLERIEQTQSGRHFFNPGQL